MSAPASFDEVVNARRTHVVMLVTAEIESRCVLRWRRGYLRCWIETGDVHVVWPSRMLGYACGSGRALAWPVRPIELSSSARYENGSDHAWMWPRSPAATRSTPRAGQCLLASNRQVRSRTG